MGNKKLNVIRRVFTAASMLPLGGIGIGFMLPVSSSQATIAAPDEVVVTARRTEEVIQNVPISMTVFNQEMLSERNVTTAADLVSYTPSLNVDSRFGSDQASFAIRGFTQDLRTTASVAVYFADVVAPRGGGNVTAGDGAGPGAFFDLQNVQILKGPQGTLFGRNTTGGAIQLVPHEPTGNLEGYVELSRGNYDLNRTQGVINIPLSDSARARFGLDAQRRDGFMKNVSGVGPSRLANIDYLAGRASLMLDVTDSLQNYTIFTYTDSENNGSIQGMFVCNPDTGFNAAPLNLCDQALSRQGDDFYNVASGDAAKPVSKLKQWQAINTTTWNVSDALTIKNILSYANLEQDMRTSVFGSNFRLSTIPTTTIPMMGPDAKPYWPIAFFPSGQLPGIHTNDQATIVEELQASGTALDDKLTWQAGYYYENSRPNDWSGAQSPALISCWGELGNDPDAWNCADLLGLGTVQRQLAKVEYNNQAIYSQGTYDINDEFRVTLGLRYTVDTTKASSKRIIFSGFPDGLGLMIPGFALPGGPANEACALSTASLADGCRHRVRQKSEAPTGLIDIDYLPTADVMIYAKYARGYRQGSIVTAAPEGADTYDPEQVDAYELGAKTSFRGAIPGTFNIAIFYNELKDQQLQIGYLPVGGGTATTAIQNAGASTIQGVEVETTLKLLDDLSVNLAYTYLETHLDTLTPAETLTDTNGNPAWTPIPSAVKGGHLTFSPRHTVATGISYRLPLPSEIGNVSIGGTYTFTDSQISTANSKFGTLGARQLLNLNMGWTAIYGSPFDLSLFVTNALNEEYRAYTAGLYEQAGAEFGVLGEPKMWGGRIKYSFE